jgi:hypothetical protein
MTPALETLCLCLRPLELADATQGSRQTSGGRELEWNSIRSPREHSL